MTNRDDDAPCTHNDRESLSAPLGVARVSKFICRMRSLINAPLMSRIITTILVSLIVASSTTLSAEADRTPVGTAFERPPWAGFFTIRPNVAIDRTRFPFIKGCADRVQWRHVEPKPGVYDWSKMDAAIRDAARGKYYYYFVLWTGPDSPEWIYEHGVPRVTTVGHKGGTTFPYYLDRNYIKIGRAHV